MTIFRITIGCILGFFFMPSALLSETVEEKIQFYNTLKQEVNNPNLVWVPETSWWKEDRITRRQLEERVMTNLIAAGQYTHENYSYVVFSAIEYSKATKLRIINVLLPELEEEINQLTSQRNNNSLSNSSSFGDVLAEITSDKHLETLSFESFIASSNENGTAIQDSQIDSYDGNWNTASNDNYSSCPMTKPDDRSSFKAYPNGQTSGNTYRYCAYFGNGYLKLEEAYVNGKREGLVTQYSWSAEHNFSYANQRTNYSNGKRNGIQEIYLISKKGAVYRMSLTTYSDGVKHGDSSQWHENGQTYKDTNFFEGQAILQYTYHEDGSLYYCTKWGSDRKPRNCKTGELRR